VLNIASGLLLARYLGPSDYGVYSWAFAYLAFFTILTDLGIGSIIVRNAAKEPSSADAVLSHAASLKLLLSLLATALGCVIVSVFDQPSSTRVVVYMVSLSLAITTFGPYGLFSVIFQVKLRMEYPVAVRSLTSLSNLASFLVLMQLGATGVGPFVGATILSSFVGLCMMWYLSNRFVDVKLAIDLQAWKGLLRESWPLALNALFITVYTRAGLLMLLDMRGPDVVGYYSAALRLTEMLTPFVGAFMTSVFPLMSAYVHASEPKLLATYTLSFKYALMAIIPIAVGTSLLSRPIVLLTYGQGFLPSVPALSILIWSEVFIFYGFVHSYLLISMGKQRTFLAFTGIAAATNILLNVLLIPAYGELGASVAAVLSNIFGAGLVVGHLLPSTRLYNMVGARYMVKPLLASSLMGLYVCLTRSHFLLAVLGGAAVFVIAMFCIGGIGPGDVRLARAVFRR
jgi:O-antigen/teichoic acid export membrane protein